MHRTIAAQPDLFCAYYEPMIGPSGTIPDRSRIALKQIYQRSTGVLRQCLAYFL